MSTSEQTALPIGLFEQSGIGVALVDGENHLNWVNPALAQLFGSDAATLQGLTAEELPKTVSSVLFGASSMVQVQSSGGERWLQREIHAQNDVSLLLIHDVTEQQHLAADNQRLRQQIEDLKLTDDLTGLPNKRAIMQALDLQISRSRRYQNPLSVVLVHIGLADSQIHALKSGTDPLVLATARFLRDRLRWVDQIGRWEDNIFVLVLPETGQEETDGLVEKINAEQHNLLLPDGFEELQPTLSFGTAYWHKGDDMRTLLKRATEQLASD